jgi:hypothetical protein
MHDTCANRVREILRNHRVMGPILWCAPGLDGPKIGLHFKRLPELASKVGCLCCPFEHTSTTVMIYEYLLTHSLTCSICFLLVWIWFAKCLSTKLALIWYACKLCCRFTSCLTTVCMTFHPPNLDFTSSILSLHHDCDAFTRISAVLPNHKLHSIKYRCMLHTMLMLNTTCMLNKWMLNKWMYVEYYVWYWYAQDLH